MSSAPSATPVPMIVTTIVLLSLMGPAFSFPILSLGPTWRERPPRGLSVVAAAQ